MKWNQPFFFLRCNSVIKQSAPSIALAGSRREDLINTALCAIALAAICIDAQAAPKHDYTYTPVAGVHEVRSFHGCWDNTDIEKRPKIAVTMAGLHSGDVQVETRPHESGKPSTEMITFRVKNMDASFRVQLRSNDGPHCQQGVHSIAFKDTVLRNANDLNAIR